MFIGSYKELSRYITLGFIIGAIVLVSLFLAFSLDEFGTLTVFLKFWKNGWWIILPIPIWILFTRAWSEYGVVSWYRKQEYVYLEVIPPAEVERGPQIMESVFAGAFSHSSINKFEKYCFWRPLQVKICFELVSTEGKIHYYIRSPKPSRNNIEAQIYAQYPDAEIFEVEDYTKAVPRNIPNRDWDMWGATLGLVKPDPVPIRTYQQFKEDITGEMIDPLSSMIEGMSALGPGEHFWFQIVLFPAVPPEWHPQSEAYLRELCGQPVEKEKKGNFFQGITGFFSDIMRNTVRGLMGADFDFKEDGLTEKEIEEFNINRLPPETQEKAKAIIQNLSRPAFRTTMRICYVAKKDNFNKALGVGNFMASKEQYIDPNLNVLKPITASKTFALYYFNKPRLLWRKRRAMQDYLDRSSNFGTFMFSTEELATMYHFPDSSVNTFNLTQVETRKGGAPVGLPTEDDIEFED